MNTITRKVQILFQEEEDYKKAYETLYNWQEIVFRAANYISTHLYIQENLSEFFYFTEDFRLNLSNKINKYDEPGILNTSRQNTTYQLLSKKFLGNIPSSILTCLNHNISKTFKQERKEYFSGKRSLRNYKRKLPIPFAGRDIKNISLNENEKDYNFNIFNIKFRTRFGRDFSNNKIMFERAIEGDYKIAGSSIQLDKTKIYLLLTVQFESEKIKLNPDKIAKVKLSVEEPMIVTIGKKTFSIGNKEEFLYRRLSIQRKRRELQQALKYTNGGHGRDNKLKALDKYGNIEKNYINTRLHTYSKELIDLCIDNRCGKIMFENQSEEMKSLQEKIAEIKNSDLSYKEKKEEIEKNTFVLRNWSWYSLLSKIEYKSKVFNIKTLQENE